MARPASARHNLRVNLPLNLIDLSAVALVILLAVLGWHSGVLPQLLGLAGAAIGILVVIVLAPIAAALLGGLDPTGRAFVVLAGAFLIVATAEASGGTLGSALRERLGGGVAGRLDTLSGALLGVTQALVIAWLVGGLLATGPFPAMAREAQRSFTVRTLLGFLPAPSDVAGQLVRVVDASGLPQVFAGLEPVPAAPVDRPSDGQARQIAAAAIPSVVRVDALACGTGVTGTGFAIGNGYVVTNAHVVAGATWVNVIADQSGAKARGTVVLFDPELDVAVIRTPGLKLPVLHFSSTSPARGVQAAAVGHPNGGPMTVIAAAISAEIQARGRDLSGAQIVVRSVLELRAPIEPGDSGGPLVLADGTVGGLVFAQSRTDPTVGFALDPVSVAADAMPAVGSTAAANLGGCLR